MRTLQNGFAASRIFARSPLAQAQTRGTAQAAKFRSMGGKRRNRGPNTIPIDDVFEVDASSLGFGKKNRKSVVTRAQNKSAEPRQKKTASHHPNRITEPRQQPESKQKQQVIYSKEYIRSIFEVPTAAQYCTSVDPAAECSELLSNADIDVRRTYKNMSPKVTEWKWMCATKIKHETGHRLEVQGHGMTMEEAAEAADLHAICRLHQRGLLQEILPGGLYNKYVDASPSKLRQESDAKKDIIDFAARHDCLPVFTFHKLARKAKSIRARASVPNLWLDGYGRGDNVATALLQACISLKVAAEARHEEIGGGTLLVKDYTKLTTASSEKFVRFYCNQQQLHCSCTSQAVRESKTGGQLFTKVILQSESTGSEIGDSVSKRPNKPVFDGNAWPGSGPSDGTAKPETERTYEGIPMMSNKDAEAVGYLVAALALKKESAILWKTFVKEMRRGNGDILIPLSPIDIGIDDNAVEIIRNTVLDVTAVEKQNELNSFQPEEQTEEQTARRRAFSRQLSEGEAKIKSEILQRRLAVYEMNTSLTELRRKRSELPMVQYRDPVMRMVTENDVCVVVGATGSGKTTQLPQLILEEFTRAGKGGSCNVICTQPRRIAAISVAERVAAERNEPLRQSVGYSVRFDAKFPQMGGSIHYCTTGILLKQMQDSQDAAMEGISHIIVDEVHERDINNDFLLVILRQLMAHRKAAGKPTIKIILMSATIDTRLFCKYFGEGYQSGMCPYIEVPGRTFPVTSHFLDDIYPKLKETYTKSEALDLYSRDSQNYIDHELINLPKLSVSVPVATDSNDGDDGNKGLINWKSKGVIGEDGELDVGMDIGDTPTPIGIMSLTIAHLLKTTTEGSILIFLPGLQEILALEKQLMNTRPLGIDFARNPDYKVYLLHSSILQMQQEVFVNLGPGKRKIILATNIAETSITIPDVVYVVDSSKHREMQYDRARSISNLVSTWTAKSNARQRAGRAGRVQHGHYYTMASKARYETFEVSPKPEILRTDLQGLCLQVKSTGVQDIWGFLRNAIEPPSQTTVETAVDELQALRALDEKENLTPLGRLLSSLPLTPSLGKMVVLAAIFKCLDPILILAAASTSKDPFLSPHDKREEAQRVRAKWAMGTASDHAALINAFQEWRRLRLLGRWAPQTDKEFAFENYMHHNTLLHIAKTADQILDTLEESGIIEDTSSSSTKGMSRARYGSAEENVNSGSHALQVALATAGFYPNIAVRARNNHPRFLRTIHENEAAIHVSSLAAPRTESGKRYGRITRREAAPPGTLFTFSQKTQADGQGINLRSVARTYPLAVVLFGGGSSRRGRVLTVDDWIPFYGHNRIIFPLLRLNEIMEDYLERTFARLGVANQRRILAQSAMNLRAGFLEQDPSRNPLIHGIVKVLESCAPKGSLRTVYGEQDLTRSLELAAEDARQGPCADASAPYPKPSSNGNLTMGPKDDWISTPYPEPPVRGGPQLEDIFKDDGEFAYKPQRRPMRGMATLPRPSLEDIFKKWVKG